MSGGRRYLAALLLALLLVPSVGMLAAPYETSSVMERRVLAPPPSAPKDLADWLALPRAIDGWLSDHFAWRGRLAPAGLTLQARAGLKPKGALQVVQGKGDWLLLYQGLLGATGGQTDARKAARYAAFTCDLQRTARARRARFVFAPAPGPAEIYPEAVPDWVPRGSPNQSDLVLAAARACGVDPVDLRPAMRAAKGAYKLYQHKDSHWTNAGALIAFNALALAAGEPWTVDPAEMHWTDGKPFDSDLVRLMGLGSGPAELVPEPPEGYDLAPSTGRLAGIDNHGFEPAFLIPGRKDRPVVLVVGDSYTGDFLGQYFRRRGVTLAWIHAAECRFDRRILDRVKPDIIALMPAARMQVCR